MNGLCGRASPLDLSDPCIRISWAAFIPAVFVAALCLFSIPVPLPAFARKLKSPLDVFLPLREAEALSAGEPQGAEYVPVPVPVTNNAVPLWRTITLAFVALVQALIWLSAGAYILITHELDTWTGICAVLIGSTWVYGVCKPVFWPKATAHVDLFLLYVVHFIFGVLVLAGVIYDYEVFHVPLESRIVLAGFTFNLVAILVELTLTSTMPVGLPSSRINKEDISIKYSPEDYVPIIQWITFSWVYPLIKRGTNTTLNEEDVWDLSPTTQSRPVFTKFATIKGTSLLRRLFWANSLDLIVDFSLTFVSVLFNYASPFFLKVILDSIGDDATEEQRAKAYVYAFLAFLCTVLKAEADVQHLWYGRRAATRMRTELMAAIYDKALKRKDYSGIIDKDKLKDDANRKAGISTSEDPSGDEPKAGADVGKIVNLMAVDAGRIANMISGMYFIYGGPLEIIIAASFLYNLLGISAFAGFIVVLVGWPLNTYVMKRSIRIQKGVSATRDRRMAVLNEVISAVKFIKFFAWEERWIDRTMDARGVEMEWMVKARLNSILFSAIWSSAPIFVSLISFFAYVYQGNKLTVSVAFTSIALFNMIRQPLNIIPAWIVQILQTGVALKRIETYLGEEEVTEQVSSIKRARVPADSLAADDGLAISGGTFKWNEVPEEEIKDAGKGKKNGNTNNEGSGAKGSRIPTDGTANTVVDVESLLGRSGIEDHKFELRDISVRFPDGELTLITGPTASGKSALLLALLGEMTITGGKLIMSKNTSNIDEHGNMHATSYAAQSPWLRHQSIKDNILFGYPYDEERYHAVMECCALKPDLDVLEDGDQTEIGARGVSLSGGQKARVALARAVYARTKYVLLDDPLSAVDSHTARFLYEQLLQGPLLANRTVILVTHHVELVLPGAYYLVRMLDGRIDTQGTVKDLRAQGILDYITQDAGADVKQEEPVAASEASVDNAPAEPAKDGSKKPRKLIKDEHRETGGVKWSVYNAYLKASSYWTWSILTILIICSQSLGVIEKLWVREWGQAYGNDTTAAPYTFASVVLTENEALMNGFLPSHDTMHYLNPYLHVQASQKFLWFTLPDANAEPLFYVGVYGAIGLTTAIVGIVSSAVQYTGALRASRIMFRQLLEGVVRATMRWHDVTPQGRMLNRFGKDIETIDSNLASSLSAVNSSLATFAAAILTVAVIFPWFLIPAIIIGYFYRLLAIGYLNTGRDLRRMESNTRSPIFSGFGELLEGIVTVRAFSAERRFMDDLHGKIDVTTKMWYNFWMTNRWLLLNFDTLGGLAVFTTTLFALSGYVSAGTAGVCITSAMTFTMSVYWACRFWTALELDLNSVERVVEYLDLPQEAPAIIESSRPPAYWPSSTSSNALISVEDLVVKYAPELPPVLKNVSFQLDARERIGLLGRTGSGKSTLAMSILRFVEPVQGRILIDGVDISKIGIHDLRTRVTFIPQDATLFSGTLRENLDPFDEHDDAECLDVLYRVQMLSESAYQSQRNSRTPSGTSTPAENGPSTPVEDSASATASTTPTEVEGKIKITLATQVSAGGTNFSQGQRQLIAMARALLRRSAIIVLDEATSSIDFETDAKIQATIREEFGGSLLLTVAHRLRTVIDYDRLIVLDKGEVAEFDTPLNLIQKDGGIFRNMCLKSGTYTELESAARAKVERDLGQR
ncbi:multidrug resistance-associated ABC transporter [Boletus edulis BED1]|uniref:Multidrug resistance-associated ABC transporter n=1 Tax=Boletus edulis BED1 TaxID=1328754 RepID=A0AAD4BTI0_BOLED|nr:multidrug resistance-associated ABC transporter [Boletus edulis BED1]